MSAPIRPIEDLVARQRAQAAVGELVAKLGELMAHPDEAPHTPGTPGELAEFRHLLYDADVDATTPAFLYPTSLEAS